MRYEVRTPISVDQFVEVLRKSGLHERRPVSDRGCMAAMLEHADLIVTAWDGERLVGVARSVTDTAYCCYLSDLAVDRHDQGRGIGRELIARTQAALGPRCTLILLSAPSAVGFYERIGMTAHPRAWVLSRDQKLADSDLNP